MSAMSLEAEIARLTALSKELAELAQGIVEDNGIIMGQMRAICARMDAMERRHDELERVAAGARGDPGAVPETETEGAE